MSGEMLELCASVALGMIAAAAVMALWRVTRGPTLADRVIALDLLGILAAGGIGASSIVSDEAPLLYVAVLIGLLLFAGTVAFALAIERRIKR